MSEPALETLAVTEEVKVLTGPFTTNPKLIHAQVWVGIHQITYSAIFLEGSALGPWSLQVGQPKIIFSS